MEVTWKYIGLTFVPGGQSIFHDYPESGPSLRSFSAMAGLMVLAVYAWRKRRSDPIPVLGFALFVLFLAFPLMQSCLGVMLFELNMSYSNDGASLDIYKQSLKGKVQVFMISFNEEQTDRIENADDDYRLNATIEMLHQQNILQIRQYCYHCRRSRNR